MSAISKSAMNGENISELLAYNKWVDGLKEKISKHGLKIF